MRNEKHLNIDAHKESFLSLTQASIFSQAHSSIIFSIMSCEGFVGRESQGELECMIWSIKLWLRRECAVPSGLASRAGQNPCEQREGISERRKRLPL